MRNNKFNYLLVAGLLVSAVGCKKFVEHDDVNINPNKPPYVTLATFLPAIEYSTANNQTLLAYITSMFSQQMAAYSSGPTNEDQYRDVRISTAFKDIYQNGITNSKLMLDMAKEQGSPHYAGVARVLFVTNLILATDTWGDVPVKEAIQAPAILQPGYDKQEDVYAFMHNYLDEAINEFNGTNPSTLKPGPEDLIYAGDIDAWRRTAWFLKARLYMHTTKKGAVTAANNALAAIANAFTSTSKDYQMFFSERNPNPWFVNVSGRISGSATFTIGPSRRFTEALNGTTYPGLVDPRLGKILSKRTSAAQYTGITNGLANPGNSADLTDVTFLGQRTSPLLIGSFAEQKLIESEALFLANGGTATSVGTTLQAYDAYKAGITASLAKLGVVAPASTDYLNHPQVDVGAANLRLEHILREKQVVLFLNPDAWVDVRRYDYDLNLFKGMALPERINPDMNGQFIRRSLLPLDELNRNPKAGTALKPMTEKMWWDQ